MDRPLCCIWSPRRHGCTAVDNGGSEFVDCFKACELGCFVQPVAAAALPTAGCLVTDQFVVALYWFGGEPVIQNAILVMRALERHQRAVYFVVLNAKGCALRLPLLDPSGDLAACGEWAAPGLCHYVWLRFNHPPQRLGIKYDSRSRLRAVAQPVRKIPWRYSLAIPGRTSVRR